MRVLAILALFVLGQVAWADPSASFQKCLSWIGKSEDSLLANGAVQTGKDIDLREQGLQLIRIYV